MAGAGPSEDERWRTARDDADERYEDCLRVTFEEALELAARLFEDGEVARAREVVEWQNAVPGDVTGTDACLDRWEARLDESYEAIFGEPR